MPTLEEILRNPAFAELTPAQIIALTGVVRQFETELTNYGSTKTELEQAKAKITELNGTIDTLNTSVTERDTQITQLNESITASKTDYENKLTQVYFDNELAKAYQNIKLVGTMPASVVEAMKATALAQLKATGTPKLVENNGQQSLKLVDSKGATVMLDGKEATIEAVLRQTALKDIIDTTTTGGTGTGEPKVTTTGSTLIISGAKNQVEADNIIKAHLTAQGLTVLDQEFYEQFSKLRDENKVSELPLK